MSGFEDDAVGMLRDALDQAGDPVRVTLRMSRATARKVLNFFEAEHTSGAVVVPVKEMYTTTESAALLGISRASLMKLIDSSEIEAVMVGTHHRVPVGELLAYQQARQVSRERTAGLLNEFSAASANFTSNVRFGAERHRQAHESEEGEQSREH